MGGGGYDDDDDDDDDGPDDRLDGGDESVLSAAAAPSVRLTEGVGPASPRARSAVLSSSSPSNLGRSWCDSPTLVNNKIIEGI